MTELVKKEKFPKNFPHGLVFLVALVYNVPHIDVKFGFGRFLPCRFRFGIVESLDGSVRQMVKSPNSDLILREDDSHDDWIDGGLINSKKLLK